MDKKALILVLSLFFFLYTYVRIIFRFCLFSPIVSCWCMLSRWECAREDVYSIHLYFMFHLDIFGILNGWRNGYSASEGCVWGCNVKGVRMKNEWLPERERVESGWEGGRTPPLFEARRAHSRLPSSGPSGQSMEFHPSNPLSFPTLRNS